MPGLSYIKKFWGDFFFTVYLLMALILFKERSLFLDNAFQCFLLIQDATIEVNANRWPAVINRLLPWLCVKLTMGLDVILMSFSASYVLVKYGIFKLLQYLKSPYYILISYILVLSVPVAHGFFWCNSELILCFGFILIWLQSLLSNRYTLAMGFAFFAAWTHPLCIILYGVFHLFYTMQGRLKNIKFHLFSLALPLMYFIKSFGFPNWYDNMKNEEFKEALSLYRFSDSYLALENIFMHSWAITTFLLLISIVLIYKKKWLSLALLTVFGISYSLMLDISTSVHAHNHGLQFYNEINVYVLFIAASIIGLYQLKQNWLGEHRFLISLIALGILSFNVLSKLDFYSNRIKWYQTVLEKEDRLICDYKQLGDNPLVLPWASAYESLIISSMYMPHSRSILITERPEKFEQYDKTNFLLTEFREYEYSTLNTHYFKLEERPYRFKCLD